MVQKYWLVNINCVPRVYGKRLRFLDVDCRSAVSGSIATGWYAVWSWNWRKFFRNESPSQGPKKTSWARIFGSCPTPSTKHFNEKFNCVNIIVYCMIIQGTLCLDLGQVPTQCMPLLENTWTAFLTSLAATGCCPLLLEMRSQARRMLLKNGPIKSWRCWNNFPDYFWILRQIIYFCLLIIVIQESFQTQPWKG